MGLVQNFMTILVVCKFEEDPSKLKALSCAQYVVHRPKAGNSKVNGRLCPEFNLIWAYGCPGYLQVWWQYDKKMTEEELLSSQHFLHNKAIGKCFVTQWQVTPKLVVWNGRKSNYPRLYDRKFDKDPIKNEGALLGTTFFPLKVWREIVCHSRASNSKIKLQNK